MEHRGQKDRRYRPRAPIETLAALEIDGSDDKLLGLVTDVSTNGLSIRVERPPVVGEEVTVRAVLHGDERGVKGEILRVQKIDADHYVVGIRYDVLAFEDDPFLEQALRLSLPEPEPELDPERDKG